MNFNMPQKFVLFLHEAIMTDGCIMFSRCPLVRPSVRSLQTYEHGISKTDNHKPILMPIGTSGPQDRGIK